MEEYDVTRAARAVSDFTIERDLGSITPTSGLTLITVRDGVGTWAMAMRHSLESTSRGTPRAFQPEGPGPGGICLPAHFSSLQ